MYQGVNRYLHLVIWLALLFSAAQAQTVTVVPSGANAVANGQALQNALNVAAQTLETDTLILEAGATFAGPVTLPVNNGGMITVQSSAADLPPAGTRVRPSDSSKMPKLIAGAPSATSPEEDRVIRTTAAAGVHSYQFIGIEITTNRYLRTLIWLGTWAESSVSQLPHTIIFDRCYIHGDATAGARRGIAGNGGNGSTGAIKVLNSYLSDFKDNPSFRQETQAFCVWNGPGPFELRNNYFEATGENVMFGGADPSIRNLVPSNIQIWYNHFYKQPGWEGQGHVVKNILELKNAQDVHIEGNVFENNWDGESDQRGFAILFTPRNQDGRSSWSAVRRVKFLYNKILNAPQGMTILGRDDIRRSQRMEDVEIRNNLFVLNKPPKLEPERRGRLFQVSNGPVRVTIDHNTGLQNRNIIFAYDAAADTFVYSNNLTPHNVCSPGDNNCGIGGNSTGVGDPTISKYFVRGSSFTQSVLIGGKAYPYTKLICSGIDCLPDSVALNPDYSLPSGPYTAAGTDGKDIGADIAGLKTRTDIAVAGVLP